MEVTLRKDSVITLMSSGKTESMKTVYLTKSKTQEEGIVIITDLEFVMPIAVPISLNHHNLYLEMLKSYHTELCGEWKLVGLAKELAELQADVEKLEESQKGSVDLIEKKKTLISLKESQLQSKKRDYLVLDKFAKLLRDTALNTAMMRDSSIRMNYIRKHIPPSFFVISDMCQFELPVEAGLRKKFPSDKFVLWKVKFNNHEVMRHFLGKFRSLMKIKEPMEKYNEEIDETELVTVVKEYPIAILTNCLANASVYQPRENNHQDYIMRQTYQFEHQDHFFMWKVTNFVPLEGGGVKFYPMSTQAEQNSIILPGMDHLKRSLFQRVIGKNLLSNTIHFSFPPEEKLFLVREKDCREKVVSLDTTTPVVERVSCEGKIKVTKPPPPVVNRNSTKKRTFYSLSGSDDTKKPMKQQSLSFSFVTEKKPKLS